MQSLPSRLTGKSKSQSVSASKTRAAHLGERSLERIGNTPLLRLDRINDLANIELLGKAEWFNPGGSVKDRAASNIVAEGRASGTCWTPPVEIQALPTL